MYCGACRRLPTWAALTLTVHLGHNQVSSVSSPGFDLPISFDATGNNPVFSRTFSTDVMQSLLKQVPKIMESQGIKVAHHKVPGTDMPGFVGDGLPDDLGDVQAALETGAGTGLVEAKTADPEGFSNPRPRRQTAEQAAPHTGEQSLLQTKADQHVKPKPIIKVSEGDGPLTDIALLSPAYKETVSFPPLPKKFEMIPKPPPSDEVLDWPATPVPPASKNSEEMSDEEYVAVVQKAPLKPTNKTGCFKGGDPPVEPDGSHPVAILKSSTLDGSGPASAVNMLMQPIASDEKARLDSIAEAKVTDMELGAMNAVPIKTNFLHGKIENLPQNPKNLTKKPTYKLEAEEFGSPPFKPPSLKHPVKPTPEPPTPKPTPKPTPTPDPIMGPVEPNYTLGVAPPDPDDPCNAVLELHGNLRLMEDGEWGESGTPKKKLTGIQKEGTGPSHKKCPTSSMKKLRAPAPTPYSIPGIPEQERAMRVPYMNAWFDGEKETPVETEQELPAPPRPVAKEEEKGGGPVAVAEETEWGPGPFPVKAEKNPRSLPPKVSPKPEAEKEPQDALANMLPANWPPEDTNRMPESDGEKEGNLNSANFIVKPKEPVDKLKPPIVPNARGGPPREGKGFIVALAAKPGVATPLSGEWGETIEKPMQTKKEAAKAMSQWNDMNYNFEEPPEGGTKKAPKVTKKIKKEAAPGAAASTQAEPAAPNEVSAPEPKTVVKKGGKMPITSVDKILDKKKKDRADRSICMEPNTPAPDGSVRGALMSRQNGSLVVKCQTNPDDMPVLEIDPAKFPAGEVAAKGGAAAQQQEAANAELVESMPEGGLSGEESEEQVAYELALRRPKKKAKPQPTPETLPVPTPMPTPAVDPRLLLYPKTWTSYITHTISIGGKRTVFEEKWISNYTAQVRRIERECCGLQCGPCNAQSPTHHQVELTYFAKNLKMKIWGNLGKEGWEYNCLPHKLTEQCVHQAAGSGCEHEVQKMHEFLDVDFKRKALPFQAISDEGDQELRHVMVEGVDTFRWDYHVPGHTPGFDLEYFQNAETGHPHRIRTSSEGASINTYDFHEFSEELPEKIFLPEKGLKPGMVMADWKCKVE